MTTAVCLYCFRDGRSLALDPGLKLGTTLQLTPSQCSMSVWLAAPVF